jgi:hypothetical protein
MLFFERGPIRTGHAFERAMFERAMKAAID